MSNPGHREGVPVQGNDRLAEARHPRSWREPLRGTSAVHCGSSAAGGVGVRVLAESWGPKSGVSRTYRATDTYGPNRTRRQGRAIHSAILLRSLQVRLGDPPPQ